MRIPLPLTSTSLLVALSLMSLGSIKAQEGPNTKRIDLGASIQLYPAGIIPTINLEKYQNDKYSWLIRLGVNLADRQDFSPVNDNETGWGFGGSLGYRRHMPYKNGEFVLGLNMDVWNMWIDWKDDIGLATETAGQSYTFVLQPWLEGGYFFNTGSSSKLGATLGFGREINVITQGEEVAQGFIGSVSVQYYFSLKN